MLQQVIGFYTPFGVTVVGTTALNYLASIGQSFYTPFGVTVVGTLPG
ncbi:hypothetical protein M8542_36730 [Amycolatopsis sp. OK19-0408]|uniref:Uncharacterized protein n=1 Tax=Amycolatopsis iheyensis TaxID=2945988 RepID=A0A9X2NJ28_9PSEU|nr:hypothetical protein [Amycolatopsis iheyensis]MCR6488391.1 hypothetical protein [Amycolatopsis iheyensis]